MEFLLKLPQQVVPFQFNERELFTLHVSNLLNAPEDLNKSSTLIVSLTGRLDTYRVLASLTVLSTITEVGFLSKGETYFAKKTGRPDSSADRRLKVSKTIFAVSGQSNSIVACPLKDFPDEFKCILIDFTSAVLAGNSDNKLLK